MFAGILPSTFLRNGIENEHLAEQRHLTARAVLFAVDQVMRAHDLAADVPILVLGGAAIFFRGDQAVAVGPVSRRSTWANWTRLTRSLRTPRSPRMVSTSRNRARSPNMLTALAWCDRAHEVYPEPAAGWIATLEGCGSSAITSLASPGKRGHRFPRPTEAASRARALPISSESPIPTVVALLNQTVRGS